MPTLRLKIQIDEKEVKIWTGFGISPQVYRRASVKQPALSKSPPKDIKSIPPDYACVITDKGEKTITKDQYAELLDHESDYYMFIDGCSLQASKKKNATDQLIKGREPLTATGFGLLKEVIESSSGISLAHAMERIPEHLRKNNAHKYFQVARRQVDFKIKRNRWERFQRISGKEEHTVFRFNPPAKYCLIVPVNWNC